MTFIDFRDLCTAFGANMLALVDVEPVTELLTQGRRSKTGKTKSLSQWATKEIRKLKNASHTWYVFILTV
jgi:importin subunit beta-1